MSHILWLIFNIISGQARLPPLPLRKTSLVPAPTPLSRLRDFHSNNSAQKDSVPSIQEVAETFVCDPIKRPERQWPLPSRLARCSVEYYARINEP